MADAPKPTPAAPAAPAKAKAHIAVTRIDGVVEPGALVLPRDIEQQVDLLDMGAIRPLNEDEAKHINPASATKLD